MCSRGKGGFGDVAGFGVLWFQFGYRLLEYVLLDQSDMFSSPAIPFTLGLNVVALWGGRPFQMWCQGLYGDWPAGNRKNTSWLGSSCVIGLALWAVLKYCFWHFFLVNRWTIWMCSIIDWSRWLVWALDYPVVENLSGQRHLWANRG